MSKKLLKNLDLLIKLEKEKLIELKLKKNLIDKEIKCLKEQEQEINSQIKSTYYAPFNSLFLPDLRHNTIKKYKLKSQNIKNNLIELEKKQHELQKLMGRYYAQKHAYETYRKTISQKMVHIYTKQEEQELDEIAQKKLFYSKTR